MADTTGAEQAVLHAVEVLARRVSDAREDSSPEAMERLGSAAHHFAEAYILLAEPSTDSFELDEGLDSTRGGDGD